MVLCLTRPPVNQDVPLLFGMAAMTLFGETLDQLLEERGWTQDQLSDATEPNVSQGQISNYKNGRRNPSRDTVRVLARAFVSDLDEEEAQRQYQRAVNKLLDAAGFRKDFPDLADAPDDFIDTITREIGYSDVTLSAEAKRKLRESMETTIMGLVEQEKRERQISETAKFKARQAQAQKKGEGK